MIYVEMGITYHFFVLMNYDTYVGGKRTGDMNKIMICRKGKHPLRK
jgi:hypothetical protein